MKLIDRLFLIAFLFFALYFLYLPHLPGAYASALLAAVCSGCGYAALSHIFVRASAPRRLRRQNLQRGRAFVRELALMPPEQARDALCRLVGAHAQILDETPDGALCLFESEPVWVGYCLRHPESGRATAQEIAQCRRQARVHGAQEAVLLSLCEKAAPSADPELAAVRSLGGEELAQLYAQHTELLPERTSSKAETGKLRRALCQLLQPPSGRRIILHFGYALMLLPGLLLSRSPALLLCVAFHLFYALSGLFSKRKKASARLFG